MDLVSDVTSTSASAADRTRSGIEYSALLNLGLPPTISIVNVSGFTNLDLADILPTAELAAAAVSTCGGYGPSSVSRSAIARLQDEVEADTRHHGHYTGAAETLMQVVQQHETSRIAAVGATASPFAANDDFDGRSVEVYQSSVELQDMPWQA